MLNCVTSKLILFCHGKTPSSFNNLQKCMALLTPKTNFSTSSDFLFKSDSEPKKWLLYNDVIYPPQKPGEEERPAVCLFLLIFV